MIFLAVFITIVCFVIAVGLTPIVTATITMCPESYQQVTIFIVMLIGLLWYFVPTAYTFSGLVFNGVIL
jgi:hypothetical protein